MPVFKDRQGRKVLPEGDYILCLTEIEFKLSQGPKTRGQPQYDITFEVEGNDASIREVLTDHESTAWRLDQFLKACGVEVAKDEGWEFEESEARAKGRRWIQPLGLRCHVRLSVEKWTSEKTGRTGDQNRVYCFYTDRPKLTARVLPGNIAGDDDCPF
jgi:hypothetical protein